MAYMTEFSFQKLISEVDIKVKITKELFLKEIYPDGQLYDILNDVERKYLFKYAMLLKDEEAFVTNYYKYVPEEPDTEQLVFSEGGKIKYHIDSECEMLRKDFKDFYIPEEIRNLGSDAVCEFRNWFKQNGFKEKLENEMISIGKIIREFNNKYVPKYRLNPLDENSGILVVQKTNSSNMVIEDSFDVLTFRETLEVLLKKFSNHFIVYEAQKVAKHSYLINSHKDEILKKLKEILPKTPITDKNYDKIIEDLRFANQILRQIINHLKTYIKWTYDFKNKSFESVTLEDFGLECCKACSGHKV
jgi:acetone carboxylase gamma subunit